MQRLTHRVQHMLAVAFLVLIATFAGVAPEALAQTYPTSNPGYTPTAVLSATTFTTTGDYTFNANGVSAVAVRVSGSPTGLAATFQGSNDNTNWTSLPAMPVGGGDIVSAISSTGFWRVDSGGFTKVRLHVTALSSGTAIVQATGTAAPASNDAYNVNTDATALSTFTATLASTVVSSDQVNLYGRCVTVVVDLTTVTTATVTTTIQGKDAASGKYYTLLAGAAKTSAGTTPMTVCPGTAVTANVTASTPLPKVWRVSTLIADNSGTAALTGTIGASVTK